MTGLTLKIHSLKLNCEIELVGWYQENQLLTDQLALLSNSFFLISIFFFFEKKTDIF